MKIILYMATSIDGFIAKKDGDSDWVSEIDAENFERKIQETGCIIVGRRTFEQYQGDLYPVEGVTNIVVSSNPLFRSALDNVLYASSPQEAVKIAEKRGHHQALLIGGGRTNGIFLKENLIDEIYLSVHSLVLGDGIKLFGGAEQELSLTLVGQEIMGEGLVQLQYKVNR